MRIVPPPDARNPVTVLVYRPFRAPSDRDVQGFGDPQRGSIPGLQYLQLRSDPLLHLPHMADEAYYPAAVPQALEGVHHLFQGLLVEAAESLIHKKRLNLDPTGLLLDNVCQPERQGE